MFSYFAYGLGIHSEFPLPEFVPADVPCDLTIRLDSEDPPADLLREDAYVDLGVDHAVLAFRRAGAFRITAGRDILISRAPGADLSLIRLYLVGKIMATLLYQRGLLVLHASAVDIDGQAVAFVGTSGFGKSSLTAALYSCGHSVIADDVVAVDLSSSPPMAIPAFPQLRLDPEVAHSLARSDSSLLPLHPLEWKHGFRVADSFSGAPTPLSLIYLLGPESPSTTLQPHDVLIELVRHSFPARLLRSGGAPHLRQCASLASRVPVRRLARSPSRPEPSAVAARVRQDLAAVRQECRP
jgi:hypothetical protein